MPGLWTPPSVSRDLQDDALRDAAQVRLAAALKGQLEWWTRELKQIDDKLEMVWFDESAAGIAGVTPCRYHIIRWNDPPTPPSVDPVTGPSGEFIEPNSSVFEKLRAGDLWNAEVRRDRERRIREAQLAAERQRERETEARQEEILERLKAATRTQVSFNPDAAWGQNAAGAARQRAHRQSKKLHLPRAA